MKRIASKRALRKIIASLQHDAFTPIRDEERYAAVQKYDARLCAAFIPASERFDRALLLECADRLEAWINELSKIDIEPAAAAAAAVGAIDPHDVSEHVEAWLGAVQDQGFVAGTMLCVELETGIPNANVARRKLL